MRGIYLVSVWLHVLAAMTWVGGMVVFVTALMPFFRGQPETTRAAFLQDFGRRFHAVTWVCFSLMLVTGAFNLWMRGVRAGDFLRPEWHASSFGQLVLAKVTLVLLAVVISSLHERVTGRGQARWLGRLTLLLGLAIVWVAVLMVRAI